MTEAQLLLELHKENQHRFEKIEDRQEWTNIILVLLCVTVWGTMGFMALFH